MSDQTPIFDRPAGARKVRADGERTRRAILKTAADLVSVEGLGNLTIGRLAAHVGMSKSGLFAHFGSKEELQIAVVAEARRIYELAARATLSDTPPGRARLEAMCEGYLVFLEDRLFPGICFLSMVRAEYCAREGPLHDAIADMAKSSHHFLVDLIKQAQATGELQQSVDPAQLAYELAALCDAPNWTLHEPGGQAEIERARVAVRSRLDQAGTR